ncbi:ATP-binding protein [Enterococcus hulanensis]|uniref:AAA family ATPase n=1 Tax=Enterococcus hulanensis TaxID=2559929 RepID=UPI001A8D9877|nr:AAA family ATPase [Enterococcus hulanensis]MBO0458270.1 ATP-binding protein [Enterococcus hulanensis]
MKPKLLNVSIDGLSIFEENRFEFDFLTSQRVFEKEREKHVVESVYKNTYKQNVVAVAGINASGKTTTLKLLKFILDVFVLDKGLNYDKSYYDLFHGKTVIEMVFWTGDCVHYASSEMVKNSAMGGRTHLEFLNERLSTVKTTYLSKKSDFIAESTDRTGEQTERADILKTTAGKFLKTDQSIIPSLIRKEGETLIEGYVEDTLSATNRMEVDFSKIDLNVVKYLDEGIEKLEIAREQSHYDEESKRNISLTYRIKFKNQPERLVNEGELRSLLSSGTLKGMYLFNKISNVLSCGGYLLVDEIENHFNKIIVQNVISFFCSKVNLNNATLVFTTHYSELLDVVERKDAIKVLKKQDGLISLKGLNVLAEPEGKNRSAYKNSDLILSGVFGTSPSYEAYWDVFKDLQKKASQAESKGEPHE